MTSDPLIQKGPVTQTRGEQLERKEIKASAKRNDPFGEEVKVT